MSIENEDTEAAEESVLSDLIDTAGIETSEPAAEADPGEADSLEGGLSTPSDEALIAATEEQFGQAEDEPDAPDIEAEAAPAAEQPQTPAMAQGNQAQITRDGLIAQEQELSQAVEQLQEMRRLNQIDDNQMFTAIRSAEAMQAGFNEQRMQINYQDLQQREQAFAHQQQQAQFEEQAHKEVAKDYPSWNDPVKRQEVQNQLTNYLVDAGLTQQEIVNISPAGVKLALKAMRAEHTKRETHARDEVLKMKRKQDQKDWKRKQKSKLQKSTEQLQGMGSGGMSSTDEKLNQVASLIAGL